MSKKKKWPIAGDDGRFWNVSCWSPADWVSSSGTLLSLIALLFFAFAWPLTRNELWGVALLWGLVALSDLIDGKVARRYGGRVCGAKMDELGDKVKTIPTLILLSILMPAKIHWLLAAILILRDVVVTLIRNRAVREDIADIKSARWGGKIKTTLIFLGIVLVFVPDVDGMITNALFAAATLVSLMSGLEYWARYKAAKDLAGFIGPSYKDSPLTELVWPKILLRKIGLANWLGFFRFAAGFVVLPIYVGQVFGRWSNAVALTLWLLAVLTDGFDGIVARRKGETSEFGRWFDPVADKAIQYLPVVGILLYFAQLDLLYVLTKPFVLFFLVPIVARDLILLVVWRDTDTKPEPHLVSKMRAFMIAVIVGGVAFAMADIADVVLIVIAICAVPLAWGFSICSVVIEWKNMLRLKKRSAG